MMGDAAKSPPQAFLGGGGLQSTAHDYQRFVQMLVRGGEFDGVRILSPRTVRYMGSNHLPNNADLTAFGRPLFSETTFDGVGFGLGVSVTLDPVKGRVPGNAGEFAWGGAASTAFWVDPGRRPDGDLLHPVAAEQRAPHPEPAEAAGVPVDPRLIGQGAALRRAARLAACARAVPTITRVAAAPTATKVSDNAIQR